MNGRNGPLSPVSVGESEWSGISKYAGNGNSDQQYRPYSPAAANNRGQLASPPISSGSNGQMNGGGFPPRGSSNGIQSPGGPSPPSSIGRSSIGTGLYAQSDSGRSIKDAQFEASLSEHYVALKRYLAASLRDEKGNPRPNRARDKLLRLSSVQFQELSTDVFDELLRRQQGGRRNPNGGPPPEGGPPPYLLPKDTFHPKRNQARQKLSTLPPPRFRDLATDVFYELERRFPRFAGGDISRIDSPASSMRGGPPRSGNGTPVNGVPRMRRPSEASSVAYSNRSESRGGGPRIPMGVVPPSPGIPPNDYGRPTPKTFQSNTLVPNKSTMVEDDETGEEDDDGDAFGLENAARSRNSKKNSGSSETDKKLIEDYQSQVRELREKLDAMEDNLKAKDDELNIARNGERSRSTTITLKDKELSDLRMNLETRVATAQKLNDSLQSEIDRLRADHDSTERALRQEIEDLRVGGGGGARGFGGGNSDLERENQELRAELDEQQRVTEEVRIEAQNFLREMRMLSDRSTSSYEREEQLTDTINKLEEEVRDWRNRYARTKTQLRTLRASSIGLIIQQNAATITKDNGFTEANGMVKDIHVTKFQISIDELLRIARTDEYAKVLEFMKRIVVNVRSITQDIDQAPPSTGDKAQLQSKLKSRVSATANNLITASKNFASANGLSPVSLLDAAASHLTAAVVELVRTVKVRPTPAGELEDDDDGNSEPVASTGFFPVREIRPESQPPPLQGLRNIPNIQTNTTQSSNVPPPFQGLRHMSADSSAYSPINSPRDTRDNSMANGYMNGNGAPPQAPMGVGFGIRTQDSDVEDLKIYLEDQTAALVANIQSLVTSIRSDAGIKAISGQINAIADNVGSVVSATETAMSSTGNSILRVQGEPILRNLLGCRQRLLQAGETGRQIVEDDGDDDEADRAWRTWNQSLPPLAFEIARETKELVLRVDVIDGDQQRGGDDDFS
ncbi:hypothetical protein HYALB_00002548 [Hymenoscyphus albidus]|uniref:GIT Spa2 homology (SHD) domain-containing protein n=1 Tax=Hymenoscyphus albidus TaxID=595503 RepID=A0A9N9QAV4_9HELO|nr:hypothetical protein HYALB_00002548 [Hymenoscyphus albidus]